MKHAQQVQQFRTPFPINDIRAVFNPRYTRLHTGELYTYLKQALEHQTRYLTNRVDTMLVNVYSPHTGFSHGNIQLPPTTLPQHVALAFTVATSDISGYTPTNLVANVVHTSNTSYRWTSSGTEFITVTVPFKQAQNWSLTSLLPATLFYLYNTIGCMIRSELLHRQEIDIRSLDLYQMRNRFGSMPLKMLLDREPHPYWQFNAWLWVHASNLIDPATVTPELVLYYLMYLRMPKNLYGNTFSTLVDQGFVPHVKSSLIALDDNSDAPLTAVDFLAPILLDPALLSNGADYAQQMEQSVRVFRQNTDVESFGNLDDLAKNLLAGVYDGN